MDFRLYGNSFFIFFSELITKEDSTLTDLINRKNRTPSPHFSNQSSKGLCNGSQHLPLSALKDVSNYSPTIQVNK